MAYKCQSVFESHWHVRKHCGLFDVSHMLQIQVSGPDRLRFMESLTTTDVVNLPENNSTLSVYLNAHAGILDDTIISKCAPDHLYLVSNAACREKILQHLKTSASKFNESSGSVTIRVLDENALVAIQGPSARQILQQLLDTKEAATFDNIYFMETASFDSIAGLKREPNELIRITRCGYTGEDGYEVSLPERMAENVVNQLMQHTDVKPIGLAARDTLRLEAGMCLYGNELSEETTPVEASLSWLISKRRRQADAEPKLLGFEKLQQQLANPTNLVKKRVGLIGENGPQPRQNAEIFLNGIPSSIGQVTSGCLSPSLEKNIAMAYVRTEYSKPGQQLSIEIRGKRYPFTVTTLPFVPNRYVRRPKSRKGMSAL